MRFRFLFSGPASHPVIQPASWLTSQPASRPRVPLVPLKNHGKRMFSALFCPDYIRCGGNRGTLGGCQPCRAQGRGGGGEGGRLWAGGGRPRGKGVDERERRGEEGDGDSKHGEKGKREGQMGMRQQGCWGPPGTRSLEEEWCDSSRPVKGLIPWKGRGWMRKGLLVVARRGTDGKWHDRTFFRLGDILPLSSQPCP